MIIQHNMAAIHAMTQLGITNSDLKKSTERLSSGYAVNRAADNAAVLSISEKKRAQIRGLRRAAQNAEDGISFIQTGDGAMSQIAGLIQRMRELAVQAANDAVYEPDDQAKLQMEFDALQSEIDRINDQTEFNKKNVFEHYGDTYSAFHGNRIWSQDQLHTIDSSNQSLTIRYRTEEGGPEKTITLTIPEGTYTTQELMDEMDDVISALGDAADGLYLEYTDKHTCSMVLQDGTEILDVGGGLSYLFFDGYGGSKVGQLIGTTKFDPSSPLEVDENNSELKFTIEYFDGTTRDVDINIPPGLYTRKSMIDYLNEQLDGTGMVASEYGDYCIQIGGEDGIITGLRGNMFKIDGEGEPAMDSVFYDNTKYGSVGNTSASFTGGAVLVNNASDTECNKFKIDDTNDVLRIRVGKDGSAEFVEIRLGHGEYSMEEMIRELQDKFDTAGVLLDVESYGPVSGAKTPNGNQYSFQGIKLTSKETGEGLQIEFDKQGSTAYDTLFVKRTYTDQGKNATATQGRNEYTSPELTGGKISGTDNLPAVLDSSNNSFVLQVEEKNADGTTSSGQYRITLTEGIYHTIEDLLAEINKQIGNGPIGISGKIQAINAGGAIRFCAADGNQSVTSIRFGETSSAGYQALFVGTVTEYSYDPETSSGNPPKVTLDKIEDPTIIDDTNDSLTVRVGNEDRTVHLPHGTYTPDELAEEITKQLKGTSSTTTNGYNGYGEGATTSNVTTHTGSGTTTTTDVRCEAHGSGKKEQGNTGQTDAQPAQYTVPVTLESSTTIGSSNNQIEIKINGKAYSITLSDGTYTPAQLAQEIQNRLNEKIPAGSADRVNVTLQNNRLCFTTEMKGESISMEFSAATSSFFDSISKRETAATVTTKQLESSITIDSSHNIFTINVNGKPYSVQLDNGTYTQAEFARMLETKLRAQDARVSVSVSGGGLRFTTDEKGRNASIRVETGNCGSAASAMFGDQLTRTPATATVSPSLSSASSWVINENEEGTFTVQIQEGGNTKTVELTVPPKQGGYTNAELRDKLNQLLQEQGVRASVSLSGSTLRFVSTGTGADVSLNVSGSITRTTRTPDVSASVDPETGELVLQNETNDAPVSVMPKAGSAVFKPYPVKKTYNPSAPKAGSVDQRRYQLKSNSEITIPASTKISDYNKEFHFSYLSPSGMKEISISLDEGEYSYEELQDALQKKLDAALGAGELTASVTSSGITITAGNYGRDYSLSNIGGGFYEYVIQGKAVRGSDEGTTGQEGRQVVDDTYIVGRKDIRNNTCTITKGRTDQMSLDVTVNGQVYRLEITLEPGQYTADDLIKELQKKLDEQVVAAGLPEHSILVGVGTFDSGVSGADDKNSLFFYLNKDAELEEGDYRIDGLRGNALFEIFYKTEGNLIPAYLSGTKDISEGVEILPGENTFSIDVDGVTYSYTIPEGTYTCEEFLEKLNELLGDPQCDLNVSLSGNALKFEHNKMGEHEIGPLQGAARNTIFYGIEGRADYDSDLWLQIGANDGQGFKLKRFSMSTLSMGINSITISRLKYASKALRRLDQALGYLSAAQSKYGANQNRLEYTIKGNDITAENTQASESRDRDADMADEMVRYSKSNLQQQTGTAMLAQANQQTQRILALLG